MASSKFLEAINNISKEDLEEIDQQIEEHEKQLISLKIARRVVASRLGIKSEAKGGARKETQDRRFTILKLLSHNGPTSLRAIMDTLEIDDGRAVAPLLNCAWFEKNSLGKYQLTQAGSAEIVKLKRKE